ncbi:mCG147209, partial [Mus musculus]
MAAVSQILRALKTLSLQESIELSGVKLFRTLQPQVSSMPCPISKISLPIKPDLKG